MSDHIGTPEQQTNWPPGSNGGHTYPASQPAASPQSGHNAQPVGYYPAPYAAGYGGYGGYPVAQTNNSLAVVSMCLSIASFICLGFVGSIAGVIVGHAARKQIADPARPDNLGGGMATAGIVIGWINIGLWISIAIFFIIFLIVMIAAAGAS